MKQASEAKQQRDEAVNRIQLLTDKLEQVSTGHNGSLAIPKDLRGLSIQKLKTIQVCLISDIFNIYGNIVIISNVFFFFSIIPV